MLNFFTLPDGRVTFIHRGLPPDELPGYDPDPKDPYTFIPKLEPCAARTFKAVANDCCPSAQQLRYCSKFGYFQMSAIHCQTCHAEGKSVPLGVDKLAS